MFFGHRAAEERRCGCGRESGDEEEDLPLAGGTPGRFNRWLNGNCGAARGAAETYLFTGKCTAGVKCAFSAVTPGRQLIPLTRSRKQRVKNGGENG